MKLTSLSALEERKDPYVQTPDGRVVDLMPELIKAGYVPAGVATLVDRRQNAPEEVRAQYGTYFFTGDSSATNDTGAALLTLDSPVLRELNSKSPLVNGALALDAKKAQKLWKELKADKQNSLYLTPSQVDDAHGKGYVLKDGKFVPATKTVGKVWDFLSRGKELQGYAQQVSEASGGSTQVMHTLFDKSKPENPQWRSLVLNRIDYYSNVDGNDDLNTDYGRLAGESAGGAEVKVARSARAENGYSPRAVAENVLQFLADRTLQQGMPSPKELEQIIAKSK